MAACETYPALLNLVTNVSLETLVPYRWVYINFIQTAPNVQSKWTSWHIHIQRMDFMPGVTVVSFLDNGRYYSQEICSYHANGQMRTPPLPSTQQPFLLCEFQIWHSWGGIMSHDNKPSQRDAWVLSLVYLSLVAIHKDIPIKIIYKDDVHWILISDVSGGCNGDRVVESCCYELYGLSHRVVVRLGTYNKGMCCGMAISAR